MLNFLHTFNPSPILISIGPFNIYWYGLFIMLGAIIGIFTTLKLASYYNIKKSDIIDLAFWLIIGGIIGARIYYIFLEFGYYSKNLLDIFKIWNGGLAIHGAIISGLIIIYLFSKIGRDRTMSCPYFWLLTSIIVPGLALAQAIGRFGNYFNQELFGTPTNLPWGIPIDLMNRPIEFISAEYFHPTFLYESIGNFIIFLILITFHFYIIKKNKKIKNIYIVFIYLFLYSILRFSTEFIRIDNPKIIFNLNIPQIMSLFIIFLAIFIILLQKFKKPATI
ncbi:MAG: prolipoprotein diacylglyceryl transferase [Candidatus Falkowbacteria bacterium]